MPQKTAKIFIYPGVFFARDHGNNIFEIFLIHYLRKNWFISILYLKFDLNVIFEIQILSSAMIWYDFLKINVQD